MASPVLGDDVDYSADPPLVAATLERLDASRPGSADRLAADPSLRQAVVAVAAASPYLGRTCVTDPLALDVLADLDHRPDPGHHCGGAAELARWKRLETLRIAARDLLGLDGLEEVGAALADLADDVLAAALRLHPADVAVIGMGKLGARELNYASDIDLVLVGPGTGAGDVRAQPSGAGDARAQPSGAGDARAQPSGAGDARAMLAAARQSWRIDLDLRPEGRSGPIVRSLDSYLAYWDRWAQTWEFQALLKARPAAGDPELGARFAAAASERVWGRPFGAEELREVRAMKARTEGEVAKAGLGNRELKRGRGGIRDVEFAVQLLQLVHGRADPRLRAPATLEALAALAAGGYVGADDAAALAAAYRFLRTVEHRLQLWEDQQVHAVPAGAQTRNRVARVLGFRDTATGTAVSAFDEALRAHQTTVRSIHQRLFFRPLLEAFTSPVANRLAEDAVAQRLAAFGFSDAARTRQAVRELTRGFSRSSALMAQLLPLVLEWLSHAPDPDLGLLGLRSLATGRHRRDQLTAVCRESAEAARALCVLVGTGPLFVRGFERHPDALAGLADGTSLAARTREQLEERASRSLSWRPSGHARAQRLREWKSAETLRIAARDVLGADTLDATEAALTDLATATLSHALTLADPQVPLAIIGMGRLGGAELAYSSDLDVVFVYSSGETVSGSGSAGAEAARAAQAAVVSLLRVVNGETPATRIYAVDLSLRPEGRQGPLARSLDAYVKYYARWAQVWERQALLRGRFIAGDPEVGRRFAAVASDFVRDRPFTASDEREIRRIKARIEKERIPAGEDPEFHLKLGRGSLSDVEWTVQLLQLRHGVVATGTMEAMDQLRRQEALESTDAAVLGEAYRFCEATRNRLYLVKGAPSDALPATGHLLTVLARSLGTSPTALREEYRRVTRRCRRVVERVFYGAG